MRAPKISHHGFETQVNGYLDYLRERKYSFNTIRNRLYELNRFFFFLVVKQIRRIQDISAEDLEKYRLGLFEEGFSPAGVAGYLSTIRNFFYYLEDRQLIFLNPARQLVISRPPPKLPEVPSVEDVKKLLGAPNIRNRFGIRDRTILELAYSTGTRLEELSTLSIFDIDLNANTVRVVGKGRKERILPLGRQAVHWMEKYLGNIRPGLLKNKIDETALWINNKGGMFSSQGMLRIFSRYSEAAGLVPGLTCHSLRRACATHMLINGAHPVQIQMLLGHATLKNLSQYMKLTIPELKKSHRKTKPGK